MNKPMSTHKHTPGPWSLDKYGVIRDANLCRVEASGLSLICGVRDVDDIAFANTRLIAAAPDLLEALEAVVKVADRDTVEFDAARAAIAKATLAK